MANAAPAPPLSETDRARGRRLAITSHPAGNTFRLVFTQHLPTLALVSLGASELMVGIQNAFVYAFIALQLPTLRLIGHASKRRILVTSHLFAVVTAAPLIFFGQIQALSPSTAIAVAMASFALVAVGVCIGETVWFPMLRAFVEPQKIGRFFGTLRTGWHLALILFYVFSQWWLERHPGDFATLFALGWSLGVARTFLIVRLPERSERTGARIRVREALVLLREPRLRAYLLAVSWGHAARVAAIPFAIVMLRRVAHFSDSQVIYTTIAFFGGGLASLYLWGRAVDRLGALPVLRTTAIGQGLLVLALAAFEPGGAAIALMVLWFFAISLLAAGFGVADTHVLFELTPPEAPARTLVLGAVAVGIAAGALPVLAGAILDRLLTGAADDLAVYHGFFAVLGVFACFAVVPLRGLNDPART